jgi:outer membrane receptor protein involved in Fe transport
VQVKAGYRGYDRRWGEDNYPSNLDLREHDGVKQHIIPVDLTCNLEHGNGGLLTFGADYQHASYETYAETGGIETTGNDSTSMSAGLFAQEQFAWDKWVFRLGGRYNYTKNEFDLISGTEPGEKDKSWNKFLWSAGLRFNALASVSLYGNVGTSFQAPSAKSVGGTLLASDAGVPGKNGQLPNPDLDPESGIAYDLGVDIRPIKNMIIGVRGFYNKVDDAIVENSVSDDPSQSQSVNAGKATSYGFELEVKHRFKSYAEWFANYTYTKTDIENSVDPDQDGSDVSFVPDYTANFGITAFLPYDITLSPYLRLVGEYYDSTSKSGRTSFGPYEILNVKVTKGFALTGGPRVLLHLDLVNLTNNHYEMPWQFEDPGFSVFGSVEFQL